MRFRMLALCALSSMTFFHAGAENLREMFVNMPDDIIPTLTRSDRQDLMDYMDSGIKAEVKNKLDGTSEMISLTERSLSVRTSGSGRVDMTLFRLRNGKDLICIIKTVTARYDDSRVCFYDGEWNPMDNSKLIKEPEFRDYLSIKALKSDSLDMFMKKAMLRLESVEATESGLEYSFTSLDYIGPDAANYKAWIKPEPIRYKWNGKRFRRQ